MKPFLLAALLISSLAPAAQAETLTLSCSEGANRIELQSRDLESYKLKDNGRIQRRLKPTYQDEQMIQIELGNTVYQFANLGACIDNTTGARTKTLLVLSEKLSVLRPFAAIPCSCLYR